MNSFRSAGSKRRHWRFEPRPMSTALRRPPLTCSRRVRSHTPSLWAATAGVKSIGHVASVMTRLRWGRRAGAGWLRGAPSAVATSASLPRAICRTPGVSVGRVSACFGNWLARADAGPFSGGARPDDPLGGLSRARTHRGTVFFQINGLLPIDLGVAVKSMGGVLAIFGNINDLAICPLHRFGRFEPKCVRARVRARGSERGGRQAPHPFTAPKAVFPLEDAHRLRGPEQPVRGKAPLCALGGNVLLGPRTGA